MNFIISGKNIEVTTGLRDAIEQKLGKLERYFTPETEIIVTLSVEKGRQKIEVTIPVKGSLIRSAFFSLNSSPIFSSSSEVSLFVIAALFKVRCFLSSAISSVSSRTLFSSAGVIIVHLPFRIMRICNREQ